MYSGNMDRYSKNDIDRNSEESGHQPAICYINYSRNPKRIGIQLRNPGESR
jgi:hypothetical protein